MEYGFWSYVKYKMHIGEWIDLLALHRDYSARIMSLDKCYVTFSSPVLMKYAAVSMGVTLSPRIHHLTVPMHPLSRR